jgi:superfamily I DNA and/or RNA helicase
VQEDLIPQLVPIKRKKLTRLTYSNLERHREIQELVIAHIRLKKIMRKEKAYYWKHMKAFRSRRCSHAGTWYSKNSKKLREKISTMME